MHTWMMDDNRPTKFILHEVRIKIEYGCIVTVLYIQRTEDSNPLYLRQSSEVYLTRQDLINSL